MLGSVQVPGREGICACVEQHNCLESVAYELEQVAWQLTAHCRLGAGVACGQQYMCLERSLDDSGPWLTGG